MRHGIELYQSNKEEFSEGPTAIFWLNALMIVALVATFFLGDGTFFPLALGAAGVHGALWTTNQQWGMDKQEIEFWRKYRSLPANYRKTLALTPAYVKEVDGRAWAQIKQNVEDIYEFRQKNLQENDIPDGLAAKFAMIKRYEAEAAEHRKEVEKELKDRYGHLNELT